MGTVGVTKIARKSHCGRKHPTIRPPLRDRASPNNCGKVQTSADSLGALSWARGVCAQAYRKTLSVQIFLHAKSACKKATTHNLHPITSPFQSFQHLEHAKNSKSSKPTSPNLAFPNRPTFETCKKQQKLKTYIPKCCFPKSSKMPQTTKAQNLHPQMLLFRIFQDASNNKTYIPERCLSNLPTFKTCQKQQELKTYIPKRCLSKASNIRNMQTAKTQHLL